MQLTSAIAIYLLFWVFSAFLVLPFHGRQTGAEEDGPPLVAGQEPGAPQAFRPRRILVQMTVIATTLFAGWFALYTSDIVDFGALNDALRGGPPNP